MKRIILIKEQIKPKSLSNQSYKYIRIESAEMNSKIKIVTIDSPKNLNALSEDLINELSSALNNLNYDPNTKVIIVTGSGKSFISGADIRGFTEHNYVTKSTRINSLDKIVKLHYQIKKPIIAAVNGYCFGGGLEFALHCDIILASEKATIGFPEIKLGLFPGAGGTQKIVRLMGYHKSIEYILTGKNIPLKEALQAGVLNSIVNHDSLLSEALTIANSISEKGLLSLVNAKKALQMALETGLSQGFEIEKEYFNSLFSTEDKNIGIRSFIEKKRPEFIDK